MVVYGLINTALKDGTGGGTLHDYYHLKVPECLGYRFHDHRCLSEKETTLWTGDVTLQGHAALK